jgi:opacity protein-like surface antigen
MRRFVGLCALACAVGLAVPAEAGERPWYLGLEGGVEFDGNGGSSDNGWAGFLTLGSGLTSHINLEAELGYRSTSATFFDGFGLGSIDIDQTSLMFNALYEAPLGDSASIVLGAGVGGESVTYDGFMFGADENEIELAAQVKLGLNLALSESTDLVANYRYMSTLGDLDVTNSTLTVGIRSDL